MALVQKRDDSNADMYYKRIDLINYLKENSLHLFNARYKGYADAIKDVIDYDNIEAMPVENGIWKWITEDKYRCTNCHRETRVDEFMDTPIYERCPYCGAFMSCEETKKLQFKCQTCVYYHLDWCHYYQERTECDDTCGAYREKTNGR